MIPFGKEVWSHLGQRGEEGSGIIIGGKLAAAIPSFLHIPVLPKTDAVKGGKIEIRSVSPLPSDEFGPEANVVLHPGRHA